MAVFMIEPHAMAIARSPSSIDFNDKDNIDYRMLPRSSGDGMEHNGSHMEPSNSTLHSSPSHTSYRTTTSNTTHSKNNHSIPSTSTLHSSPSHTSYKTTTTNTTHSKNSHSIPSTSTLHLSQSHTSYKTTISNTIHGKSSHSVPSNSSLHSFPSHTSYKTTISNTTHSKSSHSVPSNTNLHSSPSHELYKTTSSKPTFSQTSTRKLEYSMQCSLVTEPSTGQINSSRTHNSTYEHYDDSEENIRDHRKDSSDYTRKNTFKSHENLLATKEELMTSIPSSSSKSPYHDLSYLEDDICASMRDTPDENDYEKSPLERTISHQEFVELQNTIKDLEERNAKLVEDKTKLCVQLGLQTEVNSELKKLVVAAVGDDLENNLETLLMKNAQSAVEIKHWKTLSEEYAEESDKLAIECDVWRTKFMASRMMSDELSSWKTTLYTKYKQTQSALQKILKEREELKEYLLKTKRLLHILGDKKKRETHNEIHGAGHQSVLELASVINCLVQDLTTNTSGSLQTISAPKHTATNDFIGKQNVEPTPGEKFAIQVLTSGVELNTDEQPEESTVMKRLGKQYIGNSYQSRLTTNSFRVTYDCCDRCKGAVQVV